MSKISRIHEEYYDPDRYFTDNEESEEVKDEIIHSIKQLEEAIECGEGRIKRSIYKYTNCGAWVDHEQHGCIRLGSIVEGVDECTDVHQLEFGNFTINDFWSAIKEIENQANEIWNRTHGCEDCYPEYKNDFEKEGINPINPECKSCEGAGIII